MAPYTKASSMLSRILLAVALLLCCCSCRLGVNAADNDDNALMEGAKAAFGGSLVVPQAIPSFEPLGVLHIVYGPKERRVDIGPAQQMPPERLVRQPFVAFNLSAEYKHRMSPPYVLVMIDPDASAVHTSQSCALHWMVTDVYFHEETGLLLSGFVSASYSRPNPPESPVHHRYVFLLFPQPLLFLPPIFPNAMVGARLHFNLPAFVHDYGLGSPVGGNFLKAFFTGVEIPKEELEAASPGERKAPQYTVKPGTSPTLAALIGSLMGLLWGASQPF